MIDNETDAEVTLDARRYAHAGFLLAAVALLIVVATDVGRNSAPRGILAAIVYLAAPGYAVAAELLDRRGWELIAWSAALSIAVLTMLSTAQVLLGGAHPGMTMVVICGATIAFLTRGLLHELRP